MIVENQLDRGAGRIGGIKKLEEFDELSAAVAISDQGMNFPGEQINPGQQAERAMAFILMITRGIALFYTVGLLEMALARFNCTARLARA